MRNSILWSLVMVVCFMLLKTVVLSHIPLFSLSPDFVLPIIIFIAIGNGSITGILTGFFAGLIVDTLSMAPLGLHAFFYSLIGFILGKLHGVYNFNNVFFAALVTFLVSLLKAGTFFLLFLVFGKNIRPYNVTTVYFWIETGLTVFIAPFILWFLHLFESVFFNGEAHS